MANQLSLVQGSYGAWLLTLRNESDAVITTWTGSATLSATCWRGDDQASLFSPTVAWETPASGTIRLSVSAAQSATLTVGRYLVNLSVTGTDGAIIQPVGELAVLPAPGSGTARTTYATYDDMARHAGGWLAKLQRADTDQTGFLEERADARAEFEERLHACFDPDTTFRVDSLDHLYPDNWRRTGMRDDWLIAALLANKLLVTQRIKDICSLLALSRICKRQISPTEDKGYANAASHFASEANNLMAMTTVEIDTNADGVGDVTIHLGTLPRIRG